MKNGRQRSALAALLAFGLFLAACSSGEPTETTGAEDGSTTTAGETTETTEPSTDTTEAAAAGDGIVSTYIGEPEFLQPPNTNESEGNAVLSSLFRGLIDYDPVTAEPVFNGVAESIESPDSGLTWEIVLKDGWTFHDGTLVTAQSFVDSWNYSAYGPNAAQVSGFFGSIAGYADLQCGLVTEPDPETGEDVEVADCEGQPPAATEMSGLSVTDDLNFTVTLSAPETFFMTRLGYTAYYPLPEAFFADPAAYNEAPIGNGPFMMDGTWEHDVEIRTVANPDFAGDDPAQIEGLTFRIYEDVNTAISDLLAGGIDIVDFITPERQAEVEATVPNFGESPSSSITYMGFPLYDPIYENPDVRAALSMAIDRETIVNSPIFNGTRQAAFNLQSPVIPGFQDTVCDNWNYDPEQAAALWESSGGIEGPMTVWFNSGAGHDAWVEAVVNMWGETLGIDVASVTFETADFADYLPRLDAAEATGPFRLGWGMDYPHPQNYWQLLLDSRLVPPAGSNSTFYINPEFDAKIDEANGEAELDAAIPLYQEAAAIACADTPLIPLFFGLNQYGWNDTVSGVSMDPFGNIVYTDLVAGG
jgi:oligopeptide transport system substrate-binding protein